MAVINLVNGESDPVKDIVFSVTSSSDARSLMLADEDERLVVINGETDAITISYKKDAELLIKALEKALELGWWDE